MSWIASERGKVSDIACLRELFEIRDRLGTCREPVQDEVAADEAGADGYEDHKRVAEADLLCARKYGFKNRNGKGNPFTAQALEARGLRHSRLVPSQTTAQLNGQLLLVPDRYPPPAQDAGALGLASLPVANCRC